MIGLFVFLVASTGILAGLIQSRKISEAALREETVLTVVQSHMEDIKGVPYANIVQAFTDSTKPLGTRVTLKNNDTNTLSAFDFRGTAHATDDMTVQITPVITKVPDVTVTEEVTNPDGTKVTKTYNRSIAAYLITLNYSWWVGPSSTKIHSGSGTLKTIRADMTPLVISKGFIPPTP